MILVGALASSLVNEPGIDCLDQNHLNGCLDSLGDLDWWPGPHSCWIKLIAMVTWIGGLDLILAGYT